MSEQPPKPVQVVDKRNLDPKVLAEYADALKVSREKEALEVARVENLDPDELAAELRAGEIVLERQRAQERQRQQTKDAAALEVARAEVHRLTEIDQSEDEVTQEETEEILEETPPAPEGKAGIRMAQTAGSLEKKSDYAQILAEAPEYADKIKKEQAELAARLESRRSQDEKRQERSTKRSSEQQKILDAARADIIDQIKAGANPDELRADLEEQLEAYDEQVKETQRQAIENVRVYTAEVAALQEQLGNEQDPKEIKRITQQIAIKSANIERIKFDGDNYHEQNSADAQAADEIREQLMAIDEYLNPERAEKVA